MCLTSPKFVNLGKSRYFWIDYLKDIHEITGVNDLDIDLLKECVRFILNLKTDFIDFIQLMKIYIFL